MVSQDEIRELAQVGEQEAMRADLMVREGRRARRRVARRRLLAVLRGRRLGDGEPAGAAKPRGQPAF